MTVDMDRLLRQELLYLSKRDVFDVEAVAAGITAIDFSMQDPHRPERFALFPDAAGRDAAAAARAADPGANMPRVCEVEVKPDEIIVWPGNTSDGLVAVTTNLLQWLLDTYECSVTNDYGTDMLAPST